MKRLGAAVILAAALGGAHAPTATPEAPEPIVVEVESFQEAFGWCWSQYRDDAAEYQSETYMRCMNAAYRAFGYVEPYREV